MEESDRTFKGLFRNLDSFLRIPEHAIWIHVTSSTLTVMAGAVLGPVVNQIQAGLDVSQSLAGLIITTHGLFSVLVSSIAGSFIDRYGPRRAIGGCGNLEGDGRQGCSPREL